MSQSLDEPVATAPATAPPRNIDTELLAVAFGAITLIATAAFAILIELVRVPFVVRVGHLLAAFSIGCAVPFIAAWWRAVRDLRLPALPNGAPKHNHISGWGFLLLAFSVGSIVLIAAWAAPGTEGGRGIQASWGVYVVVGLAIFFVVAAVAPAIPEPPRSLVRTATVIGQLAAPLGRLLSVVDSMLVFAVAGGAGAARESVALRYAILASTTFPCAVLGYSLPAPWGLLPIAWGFLVAIAISRRWAWVEDDRELSMLNRRYTGSHLRIGFGQDLRDEALLSFMSMFILVPLALRQIQGYSPVFEIVGDVGIMDWIGFYGTELAKAVPFVDWAEIYQVGGVAPIKVVSDEAKHIVFATRVLVDLVFLAALLQALSISARTAKLKDLFFTQQSIDRLDPFVEQREFRKLLEKTSDGQLAPKPEMIQSFPVYDPIRLAELSDPEKHPDIAIAAKELRRRDGAGNSEDFHDELLRRAMQERPDKDGIAEVLAAIRIAGPARQAYELSQARIALNGKRIANDLRTEITRLLVEAEDSDERTAALIVAVTGPDRDTVYPVRTKALAALGELAGRGNVPAIRAIVDSAASDTAAWIRNEASSILKRLGINQPPTADEAP